MKYVFVDVQNTDSTTRKLHGFEVDWQKLCDYAKNKWKCTKVFLYTGIQEGDNEASQIFEKLEEKGNIVRSKIVFSYKNRDRKISISCPSCGHTHIEYVDMGYNRKSNCDVDLTVDVMNLISKGDDIYLFTGDGDFEYLVRKVIERGVKAYIVSSADKIKSGKDYFTSRYSTKLRKLVSEHPSDVIFIPINNLRLQIEQNERAAKRDSL